MLYCTRFFDCLCRHAHSLVCVGGTSSRIFVWSYGGKSSGTTAVLSNFGVQKVWLNLLIFFKGIIFAVDLFKPSFTSACLLASAAEDRSVVLWSSQFNEMCESPHLRFRHWNVLRCLDAYALNTRVPLFESRVWCVQMNDWGMVSAGEVRITNSIQQIKDCSLVCCPWRDSDCNLEPIVLKSVHRGRSIWGLDTRVSKATTKFQIVCLLSL